MTARAQDLFRNVLIMMAAIIIVSSGTTTSLAQAPVPSSVPPRWELDYKVTNDLRLIIIDDQYYWFMTILVTNKTGEDQRFVPSAVLYTDAGDITSESDQVDYAISKKLLELIGNPLLETTTQIIGTIRQEKENARECLLVWKAGNLDIDEVSVFINGMSSETQIAVNPFTGEERIVRKTAHLHYKVPGDPTARIQKPAFRNETNWIMR